MKKQIWENIAWKILTIIDLQSSANILHNSEQCAFNVAHLNMKNVIFLSSWFLRMAVSKKQWSSSNTVVGKLSRFSAHELRPWWSCGRKWSKARPPVLSSASNFIFGKHFCEININERLKFQRDGVTACGLFLATGLVLERMKLEHKVDVTLAVRTVRKSRPTFITNLVWVFGLVVL